MPAPDESMETATGMKEAPPAVEEKPEWWASPAVVGLMGFGTTTMIAGLSNLPTPYGAGFNGNWVVYGMAIAFGGIAQLIAGLIALRKGNMFAGSAFMGYGAFWLAFTLMLSGVGNFVGGAGATTPVYYGVAGFAFIWMMFTFSFLINAPKHGWGILMVFLFLFIAFILLVVKFWSLASGSTTFAADGSANWAVGGEIIFTGLIAWYVATADLTNWNYGRKVLPV
ncbi:MAG TPA: acetate uptake transporter [Thermoplasmata archaeon]|nr:acetate uptake transporter [Thermoplasmata archaeon]